MDTRLYRMLIEIRDGQRALQPWMSAAVGEGRLVAVSRGPGSATAAVIEAAQLRVAVEAAEAGAPKRDSAVGTVAEPSDLAGELAHQKAVARAFRRSPIRRRGSGRTDPFRGKGNRVSDQRVPMPFDASYYADPYAFHASLREAGPVHHFMTPDGSPAWIVPRAADVARLFGDPRLSLNKANSRTGYAGFSLPPELDANMMNMDGDDHQRLRRIVSRSFTARRVEQMADGIRAVASDLADRAARRADRRPRRRVRGPFARSPSSATSSVFPWRTGPGSPPGPPPCSRRRSP
ncbi:DUF6545 domain-containing protein [Kutzneria kofuensis]|uniref:DUF6545 domain-containing protein n=1 Tax=Kutzneria kofuensis TaxID=103725 RepID=UPI0031E78778